MSGDYTNTGGRSDTYNAGAAHDTGLYDPNRYDNQIVAVFEDRDAADRARDALLGAGVPDAAVQVLDHVAGDAVPDASHVEDRNQEVGIWGAIKSLFAPEQDATDYDRALGRGHAMVVVMPTPGTDRHRVIQVLESAEPIDFDAKLAEWRQAAPDSTGAPTSTETGRRDPPGRDATPGAGTSRTDAVRVVEERFRKAWREQPQGAVRVRSYVAERSPANHEVRLHEEDLRGNSPGVAKSDVGPLT